MTIRLLEIGVFLCFTLISSSLAAITHGFVPKQDLTPGLATAEGDSVVFDFDNAVVDFNFIDIPVTIISDKVINALTFSVTLDTNRLTFESIVDHTGELQFAAFLNPIDSKLRFTSNSLTRYPTAPDKVISVRFKVFADEFLKSDLEDLRVILNSDVVTDVVTGEDISGIISSVYEPIVDEIFIVPNPATALITVSSDHSASLDIYDINGRLVMRDISLGAASATTVEISTLPSGNYVARLTGEDGVVKVQKLIIH